MYSRENHLITCIQNSCQKTRPHKKVFHVLLENILQTFVEHPLRMSPCMPALIGLKAVKRVLSVAGWQQDTRKRHLLHRKKNSFTSHFLGSKGIYFKTLYFSYSAILSRHSLTVFI